jgi:hypothetical protein
MLHYIYINKLVLTGHIAVNQISTEKDAPDSSATIAGSVFLVLHNRDLGKIKKIL